MNSRAPGTVRLTNITFVATVVSIAFIAFHVTSGPADPEAIWINLLISLLGLLSGWLVGTGLAPYDKLDEKRFKKISVTASAFLSGYVVSKLDRLLEATLLQTSSLHPLAWARTGLFSAAFLVTGLTVFINRFYSK